MKPSVTLTLTSLLSIVLLSLHIAEDIVLGFAPGGLTNLVGIAILVVYLCGARPAPPAHGAPARRPLSICRYEPCTTGRTIHPEVRMPDHRDTTPAEGREPVRQDDAQRSERQADRAPAEPRQDKVGDGQDSVTSRPRGTTEDPDRTL